LVIVAAPEMVMVSKPLRPRALAGYTWLLREPGSGTRATAEQYLAAPGIAPSTRTLGSNGAVREAVAVGLGITLMSRDAVASELSSGRLVVINATGAPVHREWHIVTRDDGPAAWRRNAFSGSPHRQQRIRPHRDHSRRPASILAPRRQAAPRRKERTDTTALTGTALR
jgi:DNA-binding transcriptional LysR family regulator